ncbi:MAG TPA: calcium/sodium antiporter [Alphaproteobacteria bacterium]|nr:calcium/sodium antiporter [Alphaproteobacteria bacterium]HNS44206.1 calcium/sodium antiporter [Alphaproteobacteria bacterium]
MTSLLLIIAGFVLLLLGGEALVRGSVAIATKMGVSKLVIGLTLVGFGTSAPELVTSIQAALSGASGIAIGNVVGSNIANILLIIGISAVILPMFCPRDAVSRDGTVMIIATALLVLACFMGDISRVMGLIFLLGLISYLAMTFHIERKQKDLSSEMHEHESEAMPSPVKSIPLNLLIAVGGMAILVVGANLLVSGATELAKGLGVSDTVIGLTVVAVGTSLPELATSVMAALKRQSDVALGNVIGSNIFNILAILGITALVKPIPVPREILHFDLWVAVAAAVALLVFAYSNRKISRIEGGLMLGAYAVYIGAVAILS